MTPLLLSLWGGYRGQGQWPRRPMISHHAWTRPHTMPGLRLLIRICGDERGQKGSKLLQAVVCMCVCVLLAWWCGQSPSDHRTFAEALPPPPSPRCAALVSGLFVAGPGGRNYTTDDPVLLGLPAFQVGLSFVGWLWSYPPPSVATTELIPLMSPYTDHQIATISILSFQKKKKKKLTGRWNTEWNNWNIILYMKFYISHYYKSYTQ